MIRYRLNNIAKEDLLAIARWGDGHHGVERSNQYRDDLKAHFVFLAENLLVRSRLMAAIKTYIESEGITQREAAERFNVAQPRISEIYQGKIELFSADKLINMLARVGRHVEISVHKAA